jgi:hypothetical protein
MEGRVAAVVRTETPGSAASSQTMGGTAMDPKRIDDLTLDGLNFEGGGDEGDLGFFKDACRHYQQATRSTDQEAVEHIYGDGVRDDRAEAWVGEPDPSLMLELHLSARVPGAAALRASADAQPRAVRGAPLPEEADLARALAHALIWSAAPPLPGNGGVVTMEVRAQEHRRGQASEAARCRARRRSTSGGATAGARCRPTTSGTASAPRPRPGRPGSRSRSRLAH